MPVRVGIIGCGSISRFHQEGYVRCGAQIVHVCDIDREVAEKTATAHGARVSTDYSELLADPLVDLVSICTISSVHKDIALAAIAADKAVVCEKTLTDNAHASADVARAADNSRSYFATGYMKRFFPAARQAKDLLGSMGQIRSIHARTWQPFAVLSNTILPAEYAAKPSWISANFGGGVLVCGGSHILDLIHWFAGRPVQVCASMRAHEGCDFDMQTNAMLWLPGGGICHLETFWHPLTRAGYERNGWDERLEINTDTGRLDLYTVKWDEPEKNGALLVHQDAVSGRVTEYRYAAMNPFYLEMASHVRRLTAPESASPSAWDGYVVDEVIAQITASARENSVRPIVYEDQAQ